LNYGNKYFDLLNARLIGYVREDIESRRQSLSFREYCILLTILIYNIDKIANTVGHFDAYIKKPIKNARLKFYPIEILDINEIQIYREDANILAKKVKSDVVYIDPPYNSRQYNRFYHLYENLIKWDKPNLEGVAMKPPTDFSSAYCTVRARNTFADLITNLDAKLIAVSYNNTFNAKSNSSINKIQLEELSDILSAKGSTQILQVNHKFFTTGKTDFENHKEFLFLTEVSS
jgi:adenine-specific DNA-methyltransferase